MNFDSPEVEKDFPGIYEGDEENDKSLKKRKKKKDKDKGYALFEEEESDQEEMQLVSSSHPAHHHHNLADELKSPGSKLKKTKTSFRFPTKLAKDKEKTEKDHKRKEKLEKEKERQEREKEKLEKEKAEKQEKVTKKLEKERKKKKKHGGRLGRLAADAAKEEAEERAVFGVPLEVAIERSRLPDGIMLPRVFRECIDDIEERGLQQQGIYRISGVKSKVQKLKDAYNRAKPVYLPDYDPHIVAGLFKLFLRELPEPVLTPSLNSQFDEACGLPDEKSRIERFVDLVVQLPALNKLVLAWTIVHMVHVIEHEKVNKMSLENVSIVLSPTMKISHRVLNVFFTHSRVFFEEDALKKSAPSIKQDASRMSLDIPETTASIEEELKRQQTILDKLHDELLAGVKDRTKEVELWEVQRVVTTLKRKLRQMKRDDDAAIAASTTALTESTVEAAEGCLEVVNDSNTSEEMVEELNKGDVEVRHVPEEGVEKDAEDVLEGEEHDVDQKEECQTPTVEAVEEAIVGAAVAEVTEEVVEPEKDEDYVDMGHDEGYKALVEALMEEEQKLVLETEEMNQLGEELRRKMESEKSEIERLKEEMEEIRLRRAQSLEDVEMQQRMLQQSHQDGELLDQTDDGSASSTAHGISSATAAMTASTGSDVESNYSGGSGSESELDEEELHQLLQSLVKETDHLGREKRNITIQIETERTKCMNYKIQIRLMQWRTERLMTLQQKQDEKLLIDKPLMPVAASTFQSAAANIKAAADCEGDEKEQIDLKDVDDLTDKAGGGAAAEAPVKVELHIDELEMVNGEIAHANEDEDDTNDNSSPIEVTQL